MRLRRRIALALLGSSVLIGATVVALLRDPEPHFSARRGPIAAVETEPPEFAPGYRTDRLRVVSESGLAVSIALKRPSQDERAGGLSRAEPADGSRARIPVLVLLGGHQSGRDALALIGETRGVAIAALSYPFDGDHKAKGFAMIRQIPEIRAAILDTPPAILLALDWLFAQAWVDAARVELVGVSLGAPFACIAGALDPRIARVWSIHGAGDPYRLIEHALVRKIGFWPLRAAVAETANVLASGPRIAPERWVARIAPRPFVMVNADSDERIPRDAVIELYDAAAEPKEIVWLPGRHVQPKRKEIVQGLIDQVLARVTGGS